MFAECTIQYDTKKVGDICVLVEKQILVSVIFGTSRHILWTLIVIALVKVIPVCTHKVGVGTKMTKATIYMVITPNKVGFFFFFNQTVLMFLISL